MCRQRISVIQDQWLWQTSGEMFFNDIFIGENRFIWCRGTRSRAGVRGPLIVNEIVDIQDDCGERTIVRVRV